MTERLNCGHEPDPSKGGAGYAVTKSGRTYCPDCMVPRQRETMTRTGEGKLIVKGDDVQNEFGTLIFRIEEHREGKHNFSGQRHDIWFTGPDGMRWQGTRFGKREGPIEVKRVLGLHQLREQLRRHAITVYLNDGEYTVNYRHGKPATAYFTNDPMDALQTGLKMAEERDRPKPVVMED